MATKLNKKVSIATVFGKVNAAVISKHAKTVDGSLPIMRIVGLASSLKTGTTNFGDYIALQGMFKATNLDTGMVTAGSTCFIPDVALNMVAAQVGQGRTVEFGFDIHADLSENSPVGFAYTAIPLMNEEHDPLKALEERLNLPPMLAAPAAAETAPAEHAGKGKKK